MGRLLPLSGLRRAICCQEPGRQGHQFPMLQAAFVQARVCYLGGTK